MDETIIGRIKDMKIINFIPYSEIENNAEDGVEIVLTSLMKLQYVIVETIDMVRIGCFVSKDIIVALAVATQK